MPITTSVVASGNSGIDGLIYTWKWGVSALTFGFPTAVDQYSDYAVDGEQASNFDTLNGVQRAAVSAIFGSFAAVANLTFTEVADAAAGGADLRLAMSDKPGSAWAYLPHPSGVGGDGWYNNSSGIYDNPVVGNYAWMTFLHEIGHSLGLTHPHDAEGWGAMPAAIDSIEYTMMSYRAYAGQPAFGYGNEAFGFAQTPMMYDIAALQYLYGANYTTNAGNSVYRWDPATGQMSVNGVAQAVPGANKIFMTVWDGGGVDGYDLSLYTNAVAIDLRPGEWTITASAQRASLGAGMFAEGNVANALLHNGDVRSLIENATGGSGNDTLTGNTAGNRLDGGAGVDAMAGREGNDVYLVDNVGDVVLEFAGEGTDEVRTALGSRIDFTQMYILPAFVENFTGTSAGAQGLYGNALDNVVATGGGGDLVVLLDGGVDRVESGAGNDFLFYGAAFTAADSNDAGGGFDTVGLLGNFGTLTLGAASLVNVEKLAVYSSGSALGAVPNLYSIVTVDANVAAGATLMVVAQSLLAAETLTFNGAAETAGSFNIRGGRGADTLTAGAGNDQIWGNLGADTLKGGAGADAFEYLAAAESTAASRDTILEFAAGDRINLIAIDANGNSADGNSRFAFIGSGAFTGSAGQLRAYASDGGWIVEGDVDGDSAADLVIAVQTANGYALGGGDFWL